MKKENSKPAQSKQAEPVVWCGPTVSGVAKRFDTFVGVAPEALTVAIQDHPALAALLVPLEAFPEARRELETGTGRMDALDRMARAYFTKGG